MSIPNRQLFVFRNGVRTGRSKVSKGAKGHSTPMGVFTILQKNVTHESSLYKGAKMPHMQRLTWDGIAMHAGQLPDYSASHVCVRLREDFAAKLYKMTSVGTTVIIADNNSGPGTTTNPGLLFARQQLGRRVRDPSCGNRRKHQKVRCPLSLVPPTERATSIAMGSKSGRAPLTGTQRHLRLACLFGAGNGRFEWTARLVLDRECRQACAVSKSSPNAHGSI